VPSPFQAEPAQNAERGDIILNPLDARCLPWSPSAELDLSDAALAEAHAMAQATSLFPGTPGDRNWFFTYTSQLIWKYISVNYQPTAHEMAHLMEHCEPLIDDAIKGTELETMMGRNAPNQRGAVLATSPKSPMPFANCRKKRLTKSRLC